MVMLKDAEYTSHINDAFQPESIQYLIMYISN